MKAIAVMLTRAGVGLAIAPASITNNAGTQAGFTFAGVTVTGVGGTPSGFTWACDNPVGSWTVNNGQGTATATARVTGAVVGVPSTCNFRCTATIGGVPVSATCPLSYTRVS